MTEKELQDKILAGDQNAFRLLVEKFEQGVFTTCMGFLHQKEDAEEVTQDVFVEVYHALHKFRNQSALSTWIYRISVNKSLNYLRKRNSGSFFSGIKAALGFETEPVHFDHPHKALERKETEKQLAHTIDSLPEKQRICFILSRYDNLSNKEIAEVMEITESAVESLLFRGKENLRKMLKKENL